MTTNARGEGVNQLGSFHYDEQGRLYFTKIKPPKKPSRLTTCISKATRILLTIIIIALSICILPLGVILLLCLFSKSRAKLKSKVACTPAPKTWGEYVMRNMFGAHPSEEHPDEIYHDDGEEHEDDGWNTKDAFGD